MTAGARRRSSRPAVAARKNIMIAGATNAGKTTLLRALANEIPPHERLITVERALELGLGEFADLHPNVVAFEERLPNSEGQGAITMAELVRRSLRMNPSRVIVGEVLGDEIVTMLNAMSQGNDGSLSTIHANSLDRGLQPDLHLRDPVRRSGCRSRRRRCSSPARSTSSSSSSGATTSPTAAGCAGWSTSRPRGQRRRRPGAVERGLRAAAGRRTPCPPRRSSCLARARGRRVPRRCRRDLGGAGRMTLTPDHPPHRRCSARSSAARSCCWSRVAASGPAATTGRRRAGGRCRADPGGSARRLPLAVGAVLLVAAAHPVAGRRPSPRAARARSGTALFGGARAERQAHRPARGAGRLDRVAARHDRRRGRPGAGDPGDGVRRRRRRSAPTLTHAGRPAAGPRCRCPTALQRFADDLDDPAPT